MSYVNFGMSFVLQGVHHPKIAKRVAKNELLDGVFQIHVGNRQFVYLVKSVAIHSVPFSALYAAKGTIENKFILQMVFNGSAPCELHAQTESERETVYRVLQTIINNTLQSLDNNLTDKTVHKQAVVKKKGKTLSTRRILVLNTTRHCLLLFPDGKAIDQAAPKYHILLHHRVNILARKNKGLQLVGTYKNLWVAFRNREERGEWYTAVTAARLAAPPIVVPTLMEAPAFEPIVEFLPEQRQRKYIAANPASKGPSGPSAY